MTEPSVQRATAMPAGTPEVPVAIVGAGACGLAAAIALREAGVECVLLERDAAPRGSTALSSGFIPAAGTATQHAAGVQGDSPARFASDIQAKAEGSAAPHLVAAYTTAIGPALDTLQQRHGLAFERDGVWFAASALDQAAAVLWDLLDDHPEGVSVSDVRTALGTSRKYAMPLLAHMDATGMTRRRGDLRVAGPRLPPRE